MSVERFEVSSPDRVMFEDVGLTKGDLATYFDRFSEAILEQIAGRPISLFRCPKGLAAGGFFQRHPPKGKNGDGFRRIEGDRYTWFAIDDRAGLYRAAQIGAVELHPWTTRPGRLDRLAELNVDLDPGPDLDFTAVAETAHQVRDWFEGQDLTARCRATGGKGLHVVVPLPEGDPRNLDDPRLAWPFLEQLVSGLMAAHPDRFVTTVDKAGRRGRILLDMGRNQPGSTAVATHSPRARPGAPVARWVDWADVTPDLDPASVGVRDMLEGLSG